MFRLICIDGSGVGDEIPILEKIITLGRNDDNDVCILDSEVSRNHCKITHESDQLTIQDLESRNGLYINEVLSRDSQTLNSKDVLRVGNTSYLIYDDDNPPANYAEIKTILSLVPKAPEEVLINIMALQMSQTITPS